MDSHRTIRTLSLIAAIFQLVCNTGPVRAQQESEQDIRAQMKLTLQERGDIALARTVSETDRAVALLDFSQLSIYTYNFGNQLGRIQTAGRGDFPNPQGVVRSYYFTSSVALGVPAGPWWSNGIVHESSDNHSLSTIDWEAKDGARGTQFSDPPQLHNGFPIYATSDLPLTWPASGWPAPEGVVEVWAGTDTWHKWERVGDRNAYNVFDDAYADREGDGQSVPLGIEVKKRAICYGALNVIFFQYEFTNTSSYTYTDVYLGHVVDKGSPTTNDWTGAYLVYDESRQLIWARAANFDTRGDGTHARSSGEQLSFVGQMVLESPTGSFKENPYDPDNPGTNYISDPAQTLTRVALLDWGDRILQDEEGLYGAISGRDDLMDPMDAENVWKLSQGGGSPVLKQTSAHYQVYNPSWESDTDLFYYTSAGPFDMGPGASYDFVVAFVGGYTEPNMLAAADQALHTYNIQFRGPTGPSAPQDLKANGILAGPYGREFDSRIHNYPIYYCAPDNVTLTWDHSESLTTPDPSSSVLDFEGIRIYRSDDRGQTWGRPITDSRGNQAAWAPVAQFDLIDGITGDDGLSYLFLGDDTGLASSWTDNDVAENVEYWYAITAYDMGEWFFGVQALPSLESYPGSNPSAPTMIAVIPGARPTTYAPGGVSTTGALTPTVYATYPPDPSATVTVSVFNGAILEDATFRITTTGSAEYGSLTFTNMLGMTLENLSTGAKYFTSLLPEHDAYGTDLLPVADGLKVTVNSLFNATSPNDRKSYTLPSQFVPYPGYEMRYGDEWFMNSSLDHTDITDATTGFFSAEIRFDTTQTQMAYVYNRTGGYGYVGYNEFPGTAWDVDADPERQVNIAYTRQNTKGDTLDWDIDDDPLGINRHYTSILASDYSGATPDTAYSNPGGSRSDWSGSNLDHIWSMIPGMATGLTWRDLHGTTAQYYYLHPISPGMEYEFSTTAATNETEPAPLAAAVKAVPNPCYISGRWGEEQQKIQFTNVPAGYAVDIYTISGEYIVTLESQAGSGNTVSENVEWDLRNDLRQDLAYGLYLFVVKSSDGKVRKTGKFAIVR